MSSLITFITAGDPNPDVTLKFMLALEKYSDVIELGIPFSDPMADGRTIQKANVRALKAGTKISMVFDIVRAFRDYSDKVIVLMTYYNPVYVRGNEAFVKLAKDAGVDGLIVVDLPIEEAEEYLNACRKHKMDTIFLAAPNTPDERLRLIDEASSAFVYLVSLYGTTGARDEISTSAFNLLNRAKNVCKKPVCVGFGVSKKQHVEKLIKHGADGVVVGSALVQLIEKYGKDAAKKLEEKTRELKEGCRA
jgi:tryptophan synthase alpha chain